MAGKDEDRLRSDDAARQDVERIMRKAEAMGFDPGRVARALNHGPVGPVEMQMVTEVERRPVLARFFSRGFARRS